MTASIANICLFLSGLAGLIYQLCWIREATLVFGSTVYGVTTVVAVFFLGLAIGAEAGGRMGRRTTDPLRLFATLEICLGIVALLVPYGFDLSQQLLRGVYPFIAGQPLQLGLSRVVLVALVLLPPTVIMGTGLPLFVRQFAVSGSALGRSVGRLYALNTLGAACGCALAGFILIPTIGISRAIQVAAALNIGIGFVVASVRFTPVTAPLRPQSSALLAPPLTVTVLVFVLGFVALGNEVLWTRYLTLIIHTSVVTYTIALTVVLFGIVIGSLLAARVADRLSNPGRLFGTLQVLLALLSVAVISLPPASLQWLGGGIYTYALLLLFPAIVSGASLPLAVRMIVAEPDAASAVTGRLFAVNTGGGIVGSVLVGFITLPIFGLTGSMWLTSGASLAAGLAAWLLLGQRAGNRRRWEWVLAAVACWLLLPRALGTRVPADFLAQRGTLVDFREGVSANMAVVRQRDVLQLEIDRWWQGSSRKNHQVLAAHLPMLLHTAPDSVLVVGAGTGQTASRFLMYDITQLYCVDIEPGIFEFIGPHFGKSWIQDARTRLIRDDARNYIELTRRQFDVISVEVGQIFRPGAASFYTADFYRSARQRLAQDGLLAQFLPLPFFTPDEFRMVLHSFLSVFPQSVLWYNTSELLLMGVKADQFRVDGDRIELTRPGRPVGDDLDFSHWGGEEHHLNQTDVLLAGFLAGPQALSQLAGNAPLYRDDRPVLEYTTSYFTEQRATEIAIAKELGSHLEQAGAVLGLNLSASEHRSIDKIRSLNLADIIASARIRQANVQRQMGANENAARLLREALQGNPYSALAMRNLGEVLTEIGELDAALRLFRRAEALQPGDLQVRRGLGYLLHLQGNLNEAAKYYRLVLSAWREDADTHNNLGAALAAKGDSNAARRHFEQALKLRPHYADAERNLRRLSKPVPH